MSPSTDDRRGRSGTPSGAVRFSRQAVSDLVAQARATAPEEACGLLFGNRGPEPFLATITRTAAMANGEGSACATRFRIPPEEVRRAMAGAAPRAVGYFHSHPASRATASIEDLTGAWPGWVGVIIGLRDPDRPELRAYRIESDGAQTRWEPLSVAVAIAQAPGGV